MTRNHGQHNGVLRDILPLFLVPKTKKLCMTFGLLKKYRVSDHLRGSDLQAQPLFRLYLFFHCVIDSQT